MTWPRARPDLSVPPGQARAAEPWGTILRAARVSLESRVPDAAVARGLVLGEPRELAVAGARMDWGSR